jgi:hypothetical protein
MQSQGWHKKQKYQHNAQVHEKYQDHSSKLLFSILKKCVAQATAGMPKHARRDKIKEGECNTDDKCARRKTFLKKMVLRVPWL